MTTLLRRVRQPALRAGFLFLLSSLAFQGVRLLVTLIAAAALGPADFGAWVLVVAVLAYTPFASLGAVNAMNRDVPILLGQSKADDALRSEEAALGASLVSAAVLVIGVVTAGLALGADLGFVLAFGAVAGLQQVAFCYQATLRARIRFGDAAIQQFAMAAIFLVMALPGLALLGVTGLILAQAGTYGLVAALSVLRWRPEVRPLLPTQLLRDQVHRGLPIALSGLAFALVTSQDRWVVALTGTAQDLGQFGFASTLASGLILLLLVVGQQMYPRMGFTYGRSDRAAAVRLATRQSLLAGGLMGAGAIGLFVATATLVQVAMPRYAASLPPLAILCVAVCVLGVASGPTNLLVVVGRAWRLVVVYATGAVVAFVTGYLLAMSGAGLIGPACGTLVGAVVVAVAAPTLARA